MGNLTLIQNLLFVFTKKINNDENFYLTFLFNFNSYMYHLSILIICEFVFWWDNKWLNLLQCNVWEMDEIFGFW